MTKEQLQELKAAAENNDLNAVVQLKIYYINEQPDREKELYYLKKAAALHHAPSEYVLGMGCLFGLDEIPVNKRMGVQYVQAAANHGIADAWFLLGQLHANKKLDFIDYDEKKSFECFETAAKMGCANAQFELGNFYISKQKETEKAIFWWACAYLHNNEKDKKIAEMAKNRLNELAKVSGEFQKINSIIGQVKKDYAHYTTE